MQYSVDFSSQPIAVNSPPSGMRNWTKTASVGQIADLDVDGFNRASGSTAAVWVVDGFSPSGRYVKLKVTYGTRPAGAGGANGAGVFIGADENAGGSNANEARAICIATTVTKDLNIVSGTPTVQYTSANSWGLVADTLTVYVDLVTGDVFPFKNDRATHRSINLPSHIRNLFGVSSNQNSASNSSISSFSVEDIESLPAYVGSFLSVNAFTAGTSYGFDIIGKRTAKYANFVPHHGRWGKYPIKVSGVNGGNFTFEFISLDKVAGNVFTPELKIFGSLTTVTLMASFYNEDETLSTAIDVGMLAGTRTPYIASSSDAGAVSNVNSINHFYTINGSTTGMPVGSIVFIASQPSLSDPGSLTSLLNGVFAFTNANTNTGTYEYPIYIMDGTDHILRRFIGTFTFENTPMNGYLTNLVEVPYSFINEFGATENAVVTSNTITLSSVITSGALWYTEHGGEFSYDTGSGWTDWIEANDPEDAVAITSSLNPTPIKLRMNAPRTSLRERQIILTDANHPSVTYPWSVFTTSDGHDFTPNLDQDVDQIIIDLINYENNTTFTMAQLDIDNAGAYEGIKAADTTAQVHARANSGFTDSLTINYTRISLDSFNDAGQSYIALTAPYGTTWAGIVALVNAKCDIALTAADYQDEPTFANMTGGDVVWTLHAATGSLIYQGSVSLHIALKIDTLSSHITEVNLGGLEQFII